MYGKLENGVLKYAPKTILVDGVQVTNPTHEMLVEVGYLPVKLTDAPNVSTSFIAAPRWTQTENAIVQEWEILPDTNPLSADAVLRVILSAQVNSLDIPDATASRMVDYYPTLTGDGSLIKVGTKINWHGVLKQAAVDLWDTAENNPDNAPTIWVDIAYKNGIRVITDTITAVQAFALDELGWWNGHVYRSTIAANVYTPAQYAAGWEQLT
ncbi:MAG: hypothetical protein MR637_02105 [Clostridiales bacterium]|nr:hypothetical protein [Clostridiales bacterium]